MKNYTLDRVDVSEEDSVTVMAKLVKKGWKNLQYVAHNSWGDCRCPEIMGERPMTKEEIKEREKFIEKAKKSEIKKLHKLANKLGYDVMKKEGE